MSKKRRNRVKKQKQQEQEQRNYLYVGGLTAIVAIIAALYFISQSGGIGPIPFYDIHGISFTPTGELYVATHEGLLIYDEGWTIPDIPANDYMGYSGTEEGFYSSGHPGSTSNLPNPLGLVLSTDFGATVTMLKFAGESDFHAMAASYRGDAVYVYNVAPNSELAEGLHYTLDNGQTWVASAASGLSGNPINLSAHPDDSSRIAIASRDGVYLSNDSGDSFQTISPTLASAVAFDTSEGTTLYVGYQSLSQYNITDGSFTNLNTPSLSTNEAIMYISISPLDGRIALATSERDIYLSDGDLWQQVVNSGFSS